MEKVIRFFGRSNAHAFGFFLVAALLIRAQTFGHPLLHMDENFYLLVGDRIVRDGAWPYVDIWDRKPVGLFAIFGAIRLLGGDGFWQYQIASLFAVAGTAWAIFAMARNHVSAASALTGGILYMAGLPFFGGYGGQAPVFFNLLTALSALSTSRAIWPESHESDSRFLRKAAFAMLLAGIAMQLKYSVVFEGVFFGLALLWAGWRRGLSLLKLLLWASVWIVLSLLPTTIAWAIYAAAGHNEAFVFANFISVLKRTASFDVVASKRLLSLFGLLSPFLIMTALAFSARRSLLKTFALSWAAVAIAGLLLFGTYYNHYGLPLLLPLSLAALIGLDARRWSASVIASIAAFALLAAGVGTAVKLNRKGNDSEVVRVLSHMPKNQASCPWFLGTLGATLYLKSGACLPTRFPLSGHLFERQEAKAIGVSQNAEIQTILNSKPPLITVDETPRPEENLDQRAAFLTRIQREYRLADTVDAGKTKVLVFVRR